MDDDASCIGRCQVIQDVAEGWEGFCLGLQLLNRTTTPVECRAACCADPTCEVWQWGNTRENAGAPLGVCNTGRGLECSSDRSDNFLVLAGQRITHGTVSETIALERGRWCSGLGMRQAAVNPLDRSGSYKGSVAECRQVCYDDAGCSTWEHSITEGCWYGYSDHCDYYGPGSQTMVDGERVARACGVGTAAQVQTDFVRIFGVIGVVAVGLTSCAMIFLAFGPASRSLSRRFRSRASELMTGRSDEEQEVMSGVSSTICSTDKQSYMDDTSSGSD